MRRGGRSLAVLLMVSLCVQSTGAADLAFMAAARPPALAYLPPRLPPPNRSVLLKKEPVKPKVALPGEGLMGRLRDWMAPSVAGLARWLDEPMELPDAGLLLALIGGPEDGPQPEPWQSLTPGAEPQAPEPQPALEPAAAIVAPPAAPADRMLIDHSGFDMVAFGSEARAWRGSNLAMHRVVAPRLEGPWHESRGLRYRINYLKPEGFFKVEGWGYELSQGDVMRRTVRRVSLPPTYWRTYALYHEGDAVTYEIELHNTTGRPLDDLLAVTGQESFEVGGGAGRPLGPRQGASLKSLAPGEHAILSGRMMVAGFEAAGSNFEQTHLTVYSDQGEAGRLLLADDPQAGIVDPPRSR